MFTISIVVVQKKANKISYKKDGAFNIRSLGVYNGYIVGFKLDLIQK
jgi:hypothetical protein